MAGTSNPYPITPSGDFPERRLDKLTLFSGQRCHPKLHRLPTHAEGHDSRPVVTSHLRYHCTSVTRICRALIETRPGSPGQDRRQWPFPDYPPTEMSH